MLSVLVSSGAKRVALPGDAKAQCNFCRQPSSENTSGDSLAGTLAFPAESLLLLIELRHCLKPLNETETPPQQEG